MRRASRIRKLIEDLDTASVKHTGEMVSRWLPEVLGWIVPLLLLFGVWSFFFRRMSGAEGGVMSFARSKHRVFSEDDVKVSFADVAGVDEAEQELKEIVEFLENPKKLHDARRAHPERRAAGRAARNGQDAAGTCGRRRGESSLLQPERLRVCRDVCRRRRRPGARPVLAGRGEGAVHHLHRRARCARRARVQSPMGSHEEREQTLNQLLAEMDGFDSRKAHHHHGRDESSRGARSLPCSVPAASIGRCSSTSRM